MELTKSITDNGSPSEVTKEATNSIYIGSEVSQFMFLVYLLLFIEWNQSGSIKIHASGWLLLSKISNFMRQPNQFYGANQLM